MQDRREIGSAARHSGLKVWFLSLPVSTKILIAFLFLTGIFTATSGYSLLKHHAVATELRLISRGYLKMAFAIVETRTTQRLQTYQLENLLEDEEGTFVQGWITSVRRIRPIIMSNLKKDVDGLLKLTNQSEERQFLISVKKKIEATQDLYAEAEDEYEVLYAMLEEGVSPEAEEVLKLVIKKEEDIESNLRHLQSISVQRIHMVTARSEQAETRTLWMLSALILLTVSISFLTTYLIHRLLLPLGELRRGVEIIGKGNLDYRVDVRRPDEIGRFASQLNLMAAALQERDRRLILTERLAAIGKMASHIAHEVKNPLSSIGLNTELVGEEAREISEEEKRAEILSLTKSISREVDRVTSLINHYLQLGRPPKPQKAETNLASLLMEVKEFMDPEMRKNGVTVAVHGIDRPLTAVIDRDQIKQVVINLLKNAMEAMNADGGKDIEMTLAKTENHAKIVVSDTGRGMTGEERERIFEPFYTSKKGKGTRFEILLPLS